jgi:hypothetical protein
VDKISNLLEKHRTNQATKIIILQNVGNWFNQNPPVEAQTIAPDATRSLKKACLEQQQIGWDHWIKGRWSQEWAALQNHDISTMDSGIRYNSSKKWATEIITLTWEIIHKLWLKRNVIEHDVKGHPEQRKKDKIIEIIRGESIRMDYVVYSKLELENEALSKLPIENLHMINHNLKDAKINERKNHKIL